MVRVIEIGHIVAGPTAGLIMSDLGHEVIKVEQPGKGDIARHLTGTSSGTFPYFNRNKKSIALNFRTETGKEIFKRLIKTADVLIDNIGFGSLERAGLSYEVLSKINPALIYLSLKGYGKGPYEERKSLDYPIEVHSGLAYMTGLIGRPMRVGTSIVDITSAMFGVIGILDAIIERDKTGFGKYIDLGMFETSSFLIGQHIVSYQMNREPLKPINEEGFAWAIYDFFRTRDNKDIFIAVTTDPQWLIFCKALSLGLCFDEDYSTNEKRYSKRKEMLDIVSKRISQVDYEDLEKLLSKENIAHALLNRPWDLLNDPHMSQKMVRSDFNGLELSMPPIPIEGAKSGKYPLLGEDTEEILAELGYKKDEIEYFKKEKLV